jgi:2'-5' RNA ligase
MGFPSSRPATPANQSSAAAGTERLFFALWPGPIERERLGRWANHLRKAFGGRRIRDEQLHLTLAFLGNVPRERLPSLNDIAQSLIVPAFTLQFTEAGCWPRNRVAWAAPAEIPDGLGALAAGLASALDAVGLRTDDRRYFPHVTLLRDARCRPLPQALEGFEWCVREFVLVASRLQPTGLVYEVIGRWLLGSLAETHLPGDRLRDQPEQKTGNKRGIKKSCGKP